MCCCLSLMSPSSHWLFGRCLSTLNSLGLYLLLMSLAPWGRIIHTTFLLPNPYLEMNVVYHILFILNKCYSSGLLDPKGQNAFNRMKWNWKIKPHCLSLQPASILNILCRLQLWNLIQHHPVFLASLHLYSFLWWSLHPASSWKCLWHFPSPISTMSPTNSSSSELSGSCLKLTAGLSPYKRAFVS